MSEENVRVIYGAGVRNGETMTNRGDRMCERPESRSMKEIGGTGGERGSTRQTVT